MRIYFDESARGILVLANSSDIEAFTTEKLNRESLVWRSLRFPKALYIFTRSYFHRYRIASQESAVYDFIRPIAIRSNLYVVVELSHESSELTMEKNG